jgi:C4-dicarboxylate-specific signal transduction histidine kinase
MDEGPLSPTGRDALACLAEITSGQLHDLTNVVSVIRELTGLQEDLLSGQEQGRPAELERLIALVARIRHHLERGSAIIRSVRGFARGTESKDAVFDVKQKTAEVVELAQRSARLAEVELAVALPPEDVVVENDALLYQLALFRCIAAVLASASAARKVTVSCRPAPGGAEVEVASADPMRVEDVEPRVSRVARLVSGLGGEMKSLPGHHEVHRLAFVVSGARGTRVVAVGEKEMS